MPLPPSNVRTDVNSYILHDCDQLEISPKDMSSMDLQTIAFGLRVAAPDLLDEPHILDVANAIDGLSELGDPEKKYLASII